MIYSRSPHLTTNSKLFVKKPSYTGISMGPGGKSSCLLASGLSSWEQNCLTRSTPTFPHSHSLACTFSYFSFCYDDVSEMCLLLHGNVPQRRCPHSQSGAVLCKIIQSSSRLLCSNFVVKSSATTSMHLQCVVNSHPTPTCTRRR